MTKKETSKTTEVENKNNTNTKTKMIQIIALAAGLIIIFAVILFLTRGSRLSLEDKLNNSLTKMGEEFYTDFYYNEISKNKTTEEITEFLSKFKDVGIKINLDNLSRYNEKKNAETIKTFKNEKGTACNTTSTRAIIYPKSPYGRKDYTIKVELDCGFENTSESTK